jgi:spermidine synthase
MKTRLALFLVLMLGCSSKAQVQPTPKEPTATPSVVTKEGTKTTNGVLAQGRGSFGLVEVRERDGLRLLLIDDVVQGAQPLAGNLLQADPMVELLLEMRPTAKTALVIGLGTGQTAAQLTAKGISVDVIEIEPLVAAYAKQFFGFAGKVIIADGLEYMKQNNTIYDIVLMDATTGKSPPKELMTKEVIALMYKRCSEEGVIAARLLARPDDETMRTYLRQLGARHYAGFGSGLANEPQNIYAFGARQPLELHALKGLMVRPIALSEYEALSNTTEKVSLVGYLVRLSEDGSLALDLPHAEMGAIRFLLEGPALAALEALLPPKSAFPTSGDIDSDGETTETLKGLLGGGGAKRSDVRFSPVLVALEGSTQFRAAVDPERVFAGNVLSQRGPTDQQAKEPLLPYGGVLYQLSVERVLGSYDQATWKKLSIKLAPSLEKAIKSLKKGDGKSAALSLEEYNQGLQSALGLLGERLPYAQKIKALLMALQQENRSLEPKPSPLAQGIACDRVTAIERDELYWSSKEYQRLSDAFSSCAVFWYEKVAAKGPGNELAERAAGRLLELYLLLRDEKKEEMIKKKFSAILPIEEPLSLP